jgi:hypothetical protein
VLMNPLEMRRSERLSLSIPIRVIGIDLAGTQFSEDTRTSVISRGGARVPLSHAVKAGDTLRIINMENYSEADFRVAGPTSLASESPEFGVECVQPGRNIWGIELPAAIDPEAAAAGALLECRGCQQQALWVVSLMEAEVLDSTGQVARPCDRCSKITYWTYAETIRRPRVFSPSEPTAPQPRLDEALKKVEKRGEKRLGMKMPIHIRRSQGEIEITKTENMSKHGFAASLRMELNVGDMVSIVCPYSAGSAEIEQKAEVRRRALYDFGGQRLYGFRYVR